MTDSIITFQTFTQRGPKSPDPSSTCRILQNGKGLACETILAPKTLLNFTLNPSDATKFKIIPKICNSYSTVARDLWQ